MGGQHGWWSLALWKTLGECSLEKRRLGKDTIANTEGVSHKKIVKFCSLLSIVTGMVFKHWFTMADLLCFESSIMQWFVWSIIRSEWRQVQMISWGRKEGSPCRREKRQLSCLFAKLLFWMSSIAQGEPELFLYRSRGWGGKRGWDYKEVVSGEELGGRTSHTSHGREGSQHSLW